MLKVHQVIVVVIIQYKNTRIL